MLDQPVEGPPPKNWLVESILVTCFCCMPFGIVGLVHAAQVDSRYALGDIAGAERAAFEARKWVRITLWIGVGAIFLYLLFVSTIISIASKMAPMGF